MLGTGWTEIVALVAAYVIAVLATPAGVSGAVLLLPFQVSVLPLPGVSTRRRRPFLRRLRPGPVNALSKADAFGLTWPSTDLDKAELDTSWQLQRVGDQLTHKKRAEAGRTLPMPNICAAALWLRAEEQATARERAGDRWQDSDLVFTTRWGTPIEPRNFNRSFDARCARAGVPRIPVHDTRRTCAPLLAALDIHPEPATRILRHAKIAMTTEACAQVPDEITRAALKQFGDSLGGRLHAAQDRP